MSRDPRVDAYIESKAEFARPILHHVRARVHAACPGVVETIKWGMPFFTYRDRPLANMAAFKAHASFGLWDRAALGMSKDADGMGQFGRIESLADLPADDEIDAKIKAAVALADTGERPKRTAKPAKPEADVPPELVDALAGDAAASAAFAAFSPSARRDYCEWIADAKRPDTKAKRVAEAVAWIGEGKKRNWKYENC
jgi:uncharacterized protein YdeI (YjbR/CyaY-like superfamily)